MRRPLINKNASCEFKTVPCSLRIPARFSQSVFDFLKDKTPADTSEWPLRYFVAEWNDMSAPRSSDLVIVGGVAVASTINFALAS